MVASAAITDVTARQSYPWNAKVHISYTLTETVPAFLKLKVSAKDLLTGSNYVASAAALSGDTGNAQGIHNIVWDFDKQKLMLKSDEVEFSVEYEFSAPLYCVVKLLLSGGSYQVTYADVSSSSSFNKTEYKTTSLVLRLISPGTFKMGGVYNVTLTKPFYCGIFEMTCSQCKELGWCPPSNWDGLSYRSMLPIENVSYSNIRGSGEGAGWPRSSAVDKGSFIDSLRKRTGLDFDLPTEAQWEYACRAGTTTDYNSGKNNTGSICTNMNQVGKYWYNGGQYYSLRQAGTAVVGSYKPNAWGLYDMHGNVLEWCLDWNGTRSGGTDPVGPSTGSKRVMRGGGWTQPADGCTSSNRYQEDPSKDFPLTDPYTDKSKFYECGFRVVVNLPDNVGASTRSPVKIDTKTISSSPIVESLPISWGGGWIGGNTNATVLISDNGKEIKRVTGSGEFT